MQTISDHYVGPAGKDYFDYQREIGIAGARANKGRFQPYIGKSDVVLDFGCGAGELLSVLDCGDRFGVEVNPAAFAVARDRGIACHQALQSVTDESIDVAISNHALEHTLTPLHELKSIYAKLKPNGRMVLVLPMDDWRTQRDFNPRDVNHHLFAWTPQSLGNLLTEAGFTVESSDISVRSCVWTRFSTVAGRPLPEWLFRPLCSSLSTLARRRELWAIVSKKSR